MKTSFKETLERYMQIAQDIKKEFVYHKTSGEWYWYDRGSEDDQYGPFLTFWDALLDVVEPYVGPESEE